VGNVRPAAGVQYFPRIGIDEGPHASPLLYVFGWAEWALS
jgi:hypothetical protein